MQTAHTATGQVGDATALHSTAQHDIVLLLDTWMDGTAQHSMSQHDSMDVWVH